METGWIAAVSLVAFLSACGPETIADPLDTIDSSPGCSDTIYSVTTPLAISLYPRDTRQATYQVFNCDGQEALEVDPIGDGNQQTLMWLLLMATDSSQHSFKVGIQKLQYPKSNTARCYKNYRGNCEPCSLSLKDVHLCVSI